MPSSLDDYDLQDMEGLYRPVACAQLAVSLLYSVRQLGH